MAYGVPLMWIRGGIIVILFGNEDICRCGHSFKDHWGGECFGVIMVDGGDEPDHMQICECALFDLWYYT